MKNQQIQILLLVMSFDFGCCVECYHCPNVSVDLSTYSRMSKEMQSNVSESLRDCDVLDDTTWKCVGKYCRKEVRKVENGSNSEYEITWRLCSSNVAGCAKQNGCHFCQDYLCNESSSFWRNLIVVTLIFNKMLCF